MSRGHLVASYLVFVQGALPRHRGGRALAGLPSPLLEINYHFRLYKSVDDRGQYMAELLISVSLLGPSKQTSALAMRRFESKVTREKHKSKLLLKTSTTM